MSKLTEKFSPARKSIINGTQFSWLLRMEWELGQHHNHWYKHGNVEGTFEEVNRKIRTACSRLGLPVVEADPIANDHWDGERYGPLVTLQDALGAIRTHFGISDYRAVR